jgi:hypothetical protein
LFAEEVLGVRAGCLLGARVGFLVRDDPADLLLAVLGGLGVHGDGLVLGFVRHLFGPDQRVLTDISVTTWMLVSS